MENTEQQTALESAIKRAEPEVEAVEFDEDGEHVYLAYPQRGEAVRYRIGSEARRFLYGEFPDLPDGRLDFLLQVPDEPGGAA